MPGKNRQPLCKAAILGFALSLPAIESVRAGALDLACPGLETGPTRTVARVIDAETVALDDGRELRLIGALPPRAMDAGAAPGMWPLEIAALEELRAVVLGKSIELAFGGTRADRYGRLQAHAFLIDGNERRWVQGHLLGQGLARAYAQADNRACAKQVLEAEHAAREARRGLWADAAYETRSTDGVRELLRYRGTFQVVEGRIARVAQARGAIYLNFDASRQPFAVSLRRGHRELLGAYADDPNALEGKLVRARGWIEQRRGPMIDLSSGGLIEVLEASAPQSGTPRRPRATRGPQRPPRETEPPGLVETGR